MLVIVLYRLHDYFVSQLLINTTTALENQNHQTCAVIVR